MDLLIVLSYLFTRIIHAIESGIYEHWLSVRVFDPSGEVRARLTATDTAMEWDVLWISKMIGVFVIWSVGITVSIAAFAIEYGYGCAVKLLIVLHKYFRSR